MCSRSQARSEERKNLRVIQAKPKEQLTLQDMEERRLIEAIEIEQKLNELINEVNQRRNR
jgi:hypothetical protein